MNHTFRMGLLATLAASTTWLVACGGHDDPVPAAPKVTAVPSTAAASVESWIRYAQSLASSESDDGLSLESLGTLPLSETDEPAALEG